MITLNTSATDRADCAAIENRRLIVLRRNLDEAASADLVSPSRETRGRSGRIAEPAVAYCRGRLRTDSVAGGFDAQADAVAL